VPELQPDTKGASEVSDGDEGFWVVWDYGEYGPTFHSGHGDELSALRAMNQGYGGEKVMWVNWGEDLRAADDRRTGRNVPQPTEGVK
jgi:hypothetical protein